MTSGLTTYPASEEMSLAEQLETEKAIADLVELALSYWLPMAEAAVLQAAAPPPDPTAAADQEAQWNYLVDALILYGVGIIAADAMDKAFTAVAGVPMAVGHLAARAVAGHSFPGLPSRDELHADVRRVLSARLSINVSAVESRMERVPSLRAFASGHVDAVKRKVLDVVGRVFNRTRRIADRTPDVDAARQETAQVFDPAAWEPVAGQVAQTQATSTLNAAANAAALQAQRELGRGMSFTWVAIMDTRTRPAHALANGQTRPVGESFTVDGEDLRFPGDPEGSPDNIIGCRCRLFLTFTTPSPDLTASVFEKVADMTDYRSFTSVLAVIGTPTDDGRMFADNIALSFRDFPLPLLWQKQSSGGHMDAFTVGVIESAGVVGTEVIGKGYLLNTPEANEAAVQIEHGVTGPSVDLGDTEWELRDANGQPVTEEQYWENPDMELLQVVTSAKVMAATLVATPAFGQTSISMGDLVAKGDEALTAAAVSPVDVLPAYEAALFEDPQFDGPTLPHITEGGRVQGHLASFNVCHIGIQDRCVIAPRSQTDYAWFHTAPPVRTDAGPVKVGRLTVGGGHAGPSLNPAATISHYDNAGTCFALVHVGEDEHGIWFSGVAAPGATAEQVARGLAAPLSGDWRNVGGNLELVAALAVNTPGFPIIASGATNEDSQPLALVASLGPCAGDAPSPFAKGGIVAGGMDVKAIVHETILEYRAQEAQERRDITTSEILAEMNKREALSILARLDIGE